MTEISRRALLHRSALLSAGVVVLGTGAACSTSGGAPSGAGKASQLIVIGQTLQGFGEDIMLALAPPDKTYWDTIFDYMVALDAQGHFAPGLATSWDVSADHLTWAFDIREGVKFHNGDDLTVDDLVFSYNRNMFGKGSNNTLIGYAQFTDSIKADGNKLLVKTKTPVSGVFQWFAQTDGACGGTVSSEKYFAKVGSKAASRAPVGTGPYKFVRINGSQTLELTAFLDSDRSDWQKARTPAVTNLVITSPDQESTRLGLLQTGGADVTPISATDISNVSKSGARIVQTPSCTFAGMIYVGYTLNPKSPFNDVRVRQALSMAVDRAGIAKTLYNGTAQPSAAFYGGPNTDGYPTDLQPVPYDPAKAKALLAAAGYSKLPLQIVTYDEDGDFPGMPTLAEAISGYFQNIGLTAPVHVMDHAALFGEIYAKKLPGQHDNSAVLPATLELRGFGNVVDIVPDEVTGYLSTGRVGLFNSPKVDAFLNAASGEFDHAKQNAIIAEYDRWMAETYSHMPLLASSAVFGVSGKVKSWKPIISQPQASNLWTLTT